MSILESTRIEHSEKESCSVNLSDLSMTEMKSETIKSQNEEDPLIRVLEDAVIRREKKIEEQNLQLKELKNLTCQLMTQLSRFIDIESQLEEKKKSMLELEDELENEKAESAKYKGIVSDIRGRIGGNEKSTRTSEERKKGTPYRKNMKEVHFEAVSKINASTGDISFIPVCESFSVIGSCRLKSSGWCKGRHPRNICFDFRDRGKCKWNERCKFRHPLEYRRHERKWSNTHHKSQHIGTWCGRDAQESNWRRPKNSTQDSPPISSSSASPSSSCSKTERQGSLPH